VTTSKNITFVIKTANKCTKHMFIYTLVNGDMQRLTHQKHQKLETRSVLLPRYIALQLRIRRVGANRTQ